VLSKTEPTSIVTWTRRATIGAGALVLAVALIAAFWLTAHTLALLFTAVVIGEAANPTVEKLQSRKLPKGLVVLLLYLAMLGVLGGFLWFLTPRLVEQGQKFAEGLPGFLNYQNFCCPFSE